MLTHQRNLLFMGLAAVLAGMALMGQTVETVQTVERTDSLFTLLSKGGIVMIPLALCSVLAVTITMERFISLGHKNMVPSGLEDELIGVLDGTKSGKVGKAKEVCKNHPGPLADMFLTGLDHWEHETVEVEKAMADTASLRVRKLRRSIRSLRLIGSVSPLLGLLGTVVGMIRAFQTVALSSQSINKAELLAEGIYQAMVTTAAGLTIAIPTLIVYFYFNNRIDKIAENYEEIGNRFIFRFFRTRLKLEA
ncbi:MAG: MotA/TolQ/ExbB proton channel family protein [Puniceicoccaceae bacterium]